MADSATASRVPTSTPKESWSLETLLDHVLALITAHDRRYEERFLASQRALDLGFSGQKAAIDSAFAAQKAAVEAAFSAQKEAINAALAAADRAVAKAEASTDKRFDSVNEFRATLDNQQRTLIPRSEVAVLIEGVTEKINNVNKQIENVVKQLDAIDAERRGVKGGWGYAVGVIGFVLTILAILGSALAFTARVAP